MRNITCWLIVAILALQVSISGIEMSSDDNSELNESNEEVTNFAGRQSNGMSGNVTVESDCNFTGGLDGIGGPLWDSSATYEVNDIVEWPANSGQFYQTQINSSGGSVEESHWIGPCSCLEIARVCREFVNFSFCNQY